MRKRHTLHVNEESGLCHADRPRQIAYGRAPTTCNQRRVPSLHLIGTAFS